MHLSPPSAARIQLFGILSIYLFPDIREVRTLGLYIPDKNDTDDTDTEQEQVNG